MRGLKINQISLSKIRVKNYFFLTSYIALFLKVELSFHTRVLKRVKKTNKQQQQKKKTAIPIEHINFIKIVTHLFASVF